MEYWSIGVLEYWALNALLHDSITPLLPLPADWSEGIERRKAEELFAATG
jgi:hypothetical protein